jgi:hypothetical protein
MPSRNVTGAIDDPSASSGAGDKPPVTTVAPGSAALMVSYVAASRAV